MCNDGVAGFMVSHDASLSVSDEATAAFGPSHRDPLNRFLHLCHGNRAPVSSCGQNRGFIDQILQVCANKAGRLTGNQVQVYVRIKGFSLDVNVENGPPALKIGSIHSDTPIKAAGA